MRSVGSLMNKYDRALIQEKVKEQFIEALKEPKFKKLCSSIKIEEEELIKNTNKLKKTVCELNKCSKCNSLMECKNDIQGFVFYPTVILNKLDFSYIACKHKKKFNRDNKYLNNIYSFDIPDMIKNAKMKDIYLDDVNKIEIVKWLKDFVLNYKAKSKGLYLYGSFGCGKTYMLSAAFNELAKKGIKSAIIYFPEYLRMLKTTFDKNNRDTSFAECFSNIKEVDLLLIDDIGAENVTSWSRDEILGPILQYRMENDLTTFFTSNLSLEDLEQNLSTSSLGVDKVKARRIIERVKYLTIDKKLVAQNKRNKEEVC